MLGPMRKASANPSLDVAIQGSPQSRFFLELFGNSAIFPIANILLDVNTAIPLGLIINELVSNSLKHAFPAGRQGTISVRLAETEPGALSLLVRDDGIGLPTQPERANGGSLGLQLVDTLARQLRGQVLVNGEGGTAFELRFPVEPIPPQSPPATG